MLINTENNLSKLAGILLFSAVLFGCNSATSVPAGIIKLNDMKVLMWDIAQAEAYATQYIATDSIKKKNLKAETLVLYQKVFALNKTTKEDFDTSLKYYEANPPKHKILLDSLLQFSTRMKDKEIQKKYTKDFKAS